MDSSGVATASVLAVWLAAVAVIDFRTQRILNVLSLPLIAAGLIVAHWRSALPLADHLAGAGFGYLALALVGEVYFRMRGREGLGLGDAKLFAAAGAWTGWMALPFVLLAASGLGLLFALAQGRGGLTRIAFGPHLAAGFFLIWLFGAPGLPPLWR